jgi:hypothetical protein
MDQLILDAKFLALFPEMVILSGKLTFKLTFQLLLELVFHGPETLVTLLSITLTSKSVDKKLTSTMVIG